MPQKFKACVSFTFESFPQIFPIFKNEYIYMLAPKRSKIKRNKNVKSSCFLLIYIYIFQPNYVYFFFAYHIKCEVHLIFFSFFF